MEEFIGYGLVGVIALLLVLGLKKLFTKKKDLYEGDLQKIQKDLLMKVLKSIIVHIINSLSYFI